MIAKTICSLNATHREDVKELRRRFIFQFLFLYLNELQKYEAIYWNLKKAQNESLVLVHRQVAVAQGRGHVVGALTRVVFELVAQVLGVGRIIFAFWIGIRKQGVAW